jgi:hypothetical protein
MRRPLFLLAFCTFAVPIPASAQLCMGGASLADAPAQLGAGVAFSVKSRAFQVNAAGGGRVFAAAGFEYRERNDTDKHAKEIRARLGWDLPISDQLFTCPSAELSFRQFGGADWGPAGGSLTSFGAGTSFGYVLGEAEAFRIVPTFGIVVGIASDGVESALDGYARAGVGVILNRRISILSAIVVPAASDIPGLAFVVTAALGIGRR